METCWREVRWRGGCSKVVFREGVMLVEGGEEVSSLVPDFFLITNAVAVVLGEIGTDADAATAAVVPRTGTRRGNMLLLLMKEEERGE